MSTAFVIKIKRKRPRNPYIVSEMMGEAQRSSTFKDRRDRRSKDRKNSWQKDLEDNG